MNNQPTINYHALDLNDYGDLTRDDISNLIDENRKKHQKYLGEKWYLNGAKRTQHEHMIHKLDIEEMKLSMVLENMDKVGVRRETSRY